MSVLFSAEFQRATSLWNDSVFSDFVHYLLSVFMMSNPSLSSPDSGGPTEAAQVRRYFIIGERRFSNYWWACVILLGAFGFLMTGFASYLGHSVFVFNANNDINFFPARAFNVFLW